MNNIHINPLNIEIYRGIRKLKLEGFTGVNILTGDTNCGKTSVLELLNTLINPADVRVWRSLIRRPVEQKRNINYYEGFIDFFYKGTNGAPKIKYRIIATEKKEHDIMLSYQIKQESVAASTVNKSSRVSFFYR